MAKAIDPSLYASGNLNFGRFEYPHQPVTDTITYTNVTDAPVTLDLAASATAGDGTPGPPGLLTLDADQVTVPAGGTAQVEVALDGSVLQDGDTFGRYGGLVTATDGNGDQRASSRISAFLEPQRFDVTVHITPPEGATDVRYGSLLAGAFTVVPVDDQVHLHDDPMTFFNGQETMTARLFNGAYFLGASVSWRDADGARQAALPTAPEVTVAGSDVTVELDLNQARQVRTDVGEEVETYEAQLRHRRISETGEWDYSSLLGSDYQNAMDLREVGLWALPTGPVSLGTYTFTSQEVLVPPLVSMRARGTGRPIALHPRYPTPDVSVLAGRQGWDEGDEQVRRRVQQPVPRLTGLAPSRLVYAGTGTPAELDAAGVDGALVLITPTASVCGNACDEALMPLVAAAADRGAAGVLVSGDPERTSRVGLPLPESSAGFFRCPDGPDSCPPVEPYSPIPIVSLPSTEGAALADRLADGRSLSVSTSGQDIPSRAYLFMRTANGQVPDTMPWQADRTDVHRTIHRFHADQPGELTSLRWEPGAKPGTTVATLNLPLIPTQRELAIYTGPTDDEVPHRFGVQSAAYAEPMVLVPGSEFTNEAVIIQSSARDVVEWNKRPFTPGTVAPLPDLANLPVGGLFNIVGAICAGCREGDVFYPLLYRTSGGGTTTHLAGLINDENFASFNLRTATCEPPRCELHLYDEGGAEFEQRLIPVGFRVGDAGPRPGAVPGAPGGLIEEETNR